MKGDIYYIEPKMAFDFLLPKHYLGRKPQITQAFGWFVKPEMKMENMVAVCTFGKPASDSLCRGICGVENSKYVYELNRLCRIDDWAEPLSQLVGACLRRLSLKNWIVVSYSDTEMNHNGYIYQACNFIYTGMTKQRTDKFTEGGKHSRHYSKDDDLNLRKVRSAKHRYVYFSTKDKRLKRGWMSSLNYKVEPYPKGENQNYELGEYLEPKIVASRG